MTETKLEKTFRVVVYGGRDGVGREEVYRWLDLLFAPSYDIDPEGKRGTWLPRPDLLVISGAAKGVDSHAEEWAVVNWVSTRVFPADWDKLGRAAGVLRNQRMIDEGNPVLGVAFRGGRGTADMTARLKKAGIAVLEIP